MRTTAKLIRLCAVVPAGIVGSFIALMTFGFLPNAGQLATWATGLVLVVVLGFGRFEALGTRVLGFARSPRPGERALLDPAVQLVGRVGLRADRILVRRVETDGPLLQPIGRTVIVDPWLIEALNRRGISVAETAAALAHAAGALRVGPARFDLAARCWAFPWTILAALRRGIADAFRVGARRRALLESPVRPRWRRPDAGLPARRRPGRWHRRRRARGTHLHPTGRREGVAGCRARRRSSGRRPSPQ